MRILHVNKFLYRRGGAEAYMLDVATAQTERGDDIAFFGMQHPLNDPFEFDDTFPSHVELDPLPSGAVPRARAAARMFWSSSARRGIEEVCERFRPDVIHAHNVYHQLSPSVLRPRGEHIRTVMTLHDYKLVCPSYLLLANGAPCTACIDGNLSAAVELRCKGGSLAASTLLAAETAAHRVTRAYGTVDAFICPSRFLLDKIASVESYRDRLVHLPNPVVRHERPPLPRPPTTARPKVVAAARLSHEKGIDTLVRAAALLPGDIEVVIAGDGSEAPRLVELAAPLGDRLRFVGHVPGDEVRSHIDSATAVIVPSRCHENLPMVILEAFELATPVIATRMGGIPEVVTDGVNGRLVPADDEAALAAAITELVSDPGRAAALGEAGRTRIRDLAMSDHLDALDSIYTGESTSEPRTPAATPDSNGRSGIRSRLDTDASGDAVE